MAGRAPSPRRRTRSRPGLRCAVVAARFNEPITKRLLDGALHVLDASGVAARDLEVHWVPGAFELPQAALHLARARRFAAIVCVGCVIRGQTPHFDFVARQGAPGVPRGGPDEGARAFAASLVRGTKAQQPKIDAIIAETAEHWDLERMAVVDRNILRMAVYELLCEPTVPGKVAINEAIEIAKKFGTAESSRFINGVLDRIHRELRPA